MREPLPAQSLNFIVQPIGTFLADPHARLGRAHGEVFESVQLAEHEHGGLPAVHLGRGAHPRRVRPCACGMEARARSEICGIRGEGRVGLGRRDYEGGPREAHPLTPLGRGPQLARCRSDGTSITRHFVFSVAESCFHFTLFAREVDV